VSTVVNEHAPRTRSPLAVLAVGSFAAGMLGLLAVMGLYLAGQRDLPWWLSVCAVALASVGLALGLVALLREARGR
jgi:hypothetical protein